MPRPIPIWFYIVQFAVLFYTSQQLAFADVAPTRITFSLSSGWTRPIVACSFNGQKAECVLDTGSNATVLPGTLYKWSKNLPQAPNQPKDADASNPCAWVKIDTVLVSNVLVDLKNVLRCDHIYRGLVGVDVLDQRIWKFDFSKRFLEQQDSMPSGLPQFELKRHPWGQFYIPMEIAGEKVWALWDTGTAGYGSIDMAFYRQHKKLFKYARTITTVDADGARHSTKLYRLRGIGFVGGKGSTMEFLVEDYSSHWDWLKKDGVTMILGFDSLGGYTWYFDLKSNNWSVTIRS
jgi:hypothetical protein